MNQALYDTLGVKPSASDKDIRSAYRKLAKELHPDLNPGDNAAEERFKKVSAAFAILGDADKRKQYDAGEIDETGQETQQQEYYRRYADTDSAHQYRSSGGFDDFADLGDIFAEAFGRGGRAGQRSDRRSMAFPGADFRYHLTISFLDAVNGTKVRVTIPDGQVLDVTIPAGTNDGQTLRLKGKGEPGFNGGPPGDAYVSIEVLPHPLFERDGRNVTIEVPIGIHEAVLGGKVEVPTISGRVNVSIPEGATTGQTLRLSGKGIQTKHKKGDQLVRLKVVMPDKVDDELKAFMKSWADRHNYNPRQKWKGTA